MTNYILVCEINTTKLYFVTLSGWFVEYSNRFLPASTSSIYFSSSHEAPRKHLRITRKQLPRNTPSVLKKKEFCGTRAFDLSTMIRTLSIKLLSAAETRVVEQSKQEMRECRIWTKSFELFKLIRFDRRRRKRDACTECTYVASFFNSSLEPSEQSWRDLDSCHRTCGYKLNAIYRGLNIPSILL